MFWLVRVLQGSARTLYSVQVDTSPNIGMFLSSVGKCLTAKVNEITPNFLFNWRNLRQKLFNYWLRLMVKTACLMHACLKGTNDFQRQRKFEKWSPGPSTHSCYQWQHWKSPRCDSKRPKVGCSSSSWGSQFGQGKCSTNSKGGIEHEKGLCKNGSNSSVRWTKRMSQGIVFGTFATHWEWNRFVEFDNYLWRNLDIYVWSGNQVTINAVEVNIISKTKMSTHELFKVQGHVVFFDIQGIVMAELVPSGQTVNQQYYTEVLMKLCEHVRRKWPELWRNGWNRTMRQPTTHHLWSTF